MVLTRATWLHGLLLALLVPASSAFAQRETTRDALYRLEETLQMRLEDGGFSLADVSPAIVVSTMPAYEETRAWYPAAALSALARVFGAGALRACEACMAPRLYVEEGRLEQYTQSLGAPEIVRIDETARGDGPPAKAAIWVDETAYGVALRVVDLRNGRIVIADNFDPQLAGMTRTRRNFTLTRELDRRSRGDALTHTFLDVAMYPGQHISFDVAEQWGQTNANLSGVTLSLFDPVVGVGGHYYRVIPRAMNIMVGGKILMSAPTALISGVTGENTEVLDPLLTGVFILRVPIASSNYAITLSASTNARVGVGFSLLNTTLLPVLP